MKKEINIISESRNKFMNPIKSLLTLLLALTFTALLAPERSSAQPAGDALTSIEAIMRYMTSENYSKEDLMRRIVWTERLVNEVVSYIPNDENRGRFMELLDIGLDQFQSENTRLTVLLRAITTLDPLVQAYFPQWIVTDQAVILDIMRKIRDNRDDMSDADAVGIADRVLTGKARIRIIRSPRDEETLIAVLIEKARLRDPSVFSTASYSLNADNPDFEDYRVVGRRNLQSVLTQDLYNDLLAKSQYAHRDETGVMYQEEEHAEATIGVPFGGGFMWTLASGTEIRNETGEKPEPVRVGFELKIGNDWINLPFLYGAQWNTYLVYEPSGSEYFKVGPSIPFVYGDETINEELPLLKHRRLNGTWGASGEYFRYLSNPSRALGTDADGLGAAAFVSFGLRTLGTKKITNNEGEILNGTGRKQFVIDHLEGLPRDNNGDILKSQLDRHTFYYLTASATAYYWRDLGFLMNGLRLHAGIGYQKVNEARRKFFEIDATPGVDTAALSDSVNVLAGHGKLDAFLRLTLDHRGKTSYGAALQYFNGGLMGELYIHIFRWLRAEVKYSRVVFRDPEPWEHTEMIVPGLRINFVF